MKELDGSRTAERTRAVGAPDARTPRARDPTGTCDGCSGRAYGRPSAPSTTTGGHIMKIIVIGGTGRIGGNAARRLAADGHDAVPASPDTGVDTITGEGLVDVVTGADVVVD